MFIEKPNELWLTDYLYFGSLFGLKSEFPAAFYVMDEWHMYDPTFYIEYIWKLVNALDISRRQLGEALNMLLTYQGKLFHLNDEPFIFHNPGIEFDEDFKYISEFKKSKNGLYLPNDFKYDYHRNLFLELHCRILRYHAFRRSHMMHYVRLLGIDYPKPFAGDVKLLLPPNGEDEPES